MYMYTYVAAASRPPTTAAAPAASRQPLRAHQIPRHTSTNTSKARPVSHIGVPTNVTHTGHAKTEQEAKELIERLLAAGSPGATAAAAQLPAPLLPQPSPPTHSPAGGQYDASPTNMSGQPARRAPPFPIALRRATARRRPKLTTARTFL